MSDTETKPREKRAKRDDGRTDARPLAAAMPDSGLEERVRPDGGIEVVDLATGEVYSRNGNEGDPFTIPDEVRRAFPQWSFEFKRHTNLNQTDSTYEAELARNGWRDVHYESLPGVFGPSDMVGPVAVRGLMLKRRPLALTMHAREEERRKSMDQDASKRAAFEASAAAGLGNQHTPPGIRPVINSSVQPVRTVPMGTPGTKSFAVE
jgi:hypothetical protein